jgi:hypothetical protein
MLVSILNVARFERSTTYFYLLNKMHKWLLPRLWTVGVSLARRIVLTVPYGLPLGASGCRLNLVPVVTCLLTLAPGLLALGSTW